jgi:integrase
VVATDLKYTYIAKGKYWRFRHPTTGDCKLPGTPGDPAFHAKYAELVARVEKQEAPVSRSSMTWLVEQYRKSAEHRALADSTQLDYSKTLDLIVGEMGGEPFALITPAMVKAVRDDYAEKPRKAHKIKQMVSALYSWAAQEGHVRLGVNPAAPIKRLRTKGGPKEYVCWSEFEFELFMAGAISPMKTAAMLARYTGQRAEDITRMVWTDFQGEMIRVRQSKTGAPLMIACHARLRDYLNELKRSRGGTVILISAAGTPYNANSLSSAMGREVRRVKDMPRDRSIHGLRYMAGADLEEAGATVGEIEAVLGHHTFKMALKYASQRLRSKSANAKREAADGA